MEHTESDKLFLAAVAEQLEGLQPLGLGAYDKCSQCPDRKEGEDDTDYIDRTNEGHFSWTPCDGCGSHLGGDRFAAHAWTEGDEPTETEPVHLDICVDCLMYHANGELPEEWEG